MQQQCILIVDDDEDDCDFLKECLIAVGVTSPIIFAHDGPAAFDILEGLNGNLPKLIILDVNMPLMNGLTFYSKLRLTYNIPVIFYTTTCDDDLVKEARTLGAIDCVKKGVTYSDNLKFAKRVSEFVRGGT